MSNKNLAVIPARGGSTRLSNKNLYILGGKPLIRWIVDAVVRSERFDTIVVSTDSDDIYDAVSDMGVGRHIRPAEHATTKATALNAMLDLMEYYNDLELNHDTFSFFLPTCPFVEHSQIARGIDKLEHHRCDSVISMTEMQDTVQLACVMQEDHVLPIFDNLEAGLTNSKFIKKYYKPSGAFYMGYWDSIMKNRNFFKGDVRGVVIPPKNSVDIDTITDIQLAEAILNEKHKSE